MYCMLQYTRGVTTLLPSRNLVLRLRRRRGPRKHGTVRGATSLISAKRRKA
jgi:hypothetical protein